MMPIVNADSRIESALHLRSAAAKNVLANTGSDPGRRLLDRVARQMGIARGGLRPRTAEQLLSFPQTPSVPRML